VASLLPKRSSYFAYRAGAELARMVPEPIGSPATRMASAMAPAVFSRRRRQVERNLRRIHGRGFGGRELQRAVAATFDSYGRYFYELFLLPTRSRAWVERHFVCHGEEHIRAAVDAGNGAVLALPHLGNWDQAGAWLAGRGYAVTVVAETLDPPELFDWFVATRAQLGMRVIPLSPTAGTEVLKALRNNEVVCLLCDRDLTGDGIPVDFFGEGTTLPAGPAMAALRAGAPILPVGCYFRAEGVGVAYIEAPLDTERRGPLRDDMARVTQDLAHRFETMIRRDPTHWHLLQPNWPSDRSAAA
jgi:KDO2-lipid IV(A) lauroyltransferase